MRLCLLWLMLASPVRAATNDVESADWNASESRIRQLCAYAPDTLSVSKLLLTASRDAKTITDYLDHFEDLDQPAFFQAIQENYGNRLNQDELASIAALKSSTMMSVRAAHNSLLAQMDALGQFTAALFGEYDRGKLKPKDETRLVESCVDERLATAHAAMDAINALGAAKVQMNALATTLAARYP